MKAMRNQWIMTKTPKKKTKKKSKPGTPGKKPTTRAASKRTKGSKGTARNSGSKGGRPTKYKDSHCQAIMQFFDGEPYEDIELIHYQKDGVTAKWKDCKRMPRKLPTLVQFAKSIKVCYATVFNWQDEKHANFHKKFLEAFTRAKELQKDFLIQNGLQGLYNPLFAKFTAINITDMKDKSEHEIGGIDGKPIPVTIVDFKNIT